MAIKIRTENPENLLSKIKQEIKNGRIKTWDCQVHNNKEYFSHVTSDGQWKGKAWLLPKIEGDLLIFNIVKPQKATVSSIAYAVYHGRFTEMLLAHFDKNFSIAWSTALPSSGDVVA